MNVHYLQHVPFECLGSIEAWLHNRGHRITVTRLYNNEQLPALDDIDWLIVMGGPMGVEDTTNYPWLSAEKDFIKQALTQKKIVLGICLGAQLMADVLGASVTKNPHKEIGWFPIQLTEQAKATQLGSALPTEFDVFHWHGDTFSTPDNAIPLASSSACKNQGYIIDDSVLGLQFHLETTLQSALELTVHCKDDLSNSPYIQSAEDMLSQPKRFENVNEIMTTVLSFLEKSHMS